jgi:hypothetical protein
MIQSLSLTLTSMTSLEQVSDPREASGGCANGCASRAGGRAGRLVLAALLGSLTGSALPHRTAQLPREERAWIAVLSGELPDAIEQVARQAWIVGNRPGAGTMQRWELVRWVAAAAQSVSLFRHELPR